MSHNSHLQIRNLARVDHAAAWQERAQALAAASTTQTCGRMAYRGQLVISGLREFKTRSGDILLQMLDRRCSRNRQDNFGTFKQPCQCDLQRSCIQLVRKLLEGVMCLLRLTEGSSGKESNKESNIVLLAVIDDEVGFPVGEAVAVLHRDNWHDLTCPLHVFASHIRQRDMTNLTLLT